MNNYVNPLSLMYEEIMEQPTFLWKVWYSFLFLWALGLMTLTVIGIVGILYAMITDPHLFDNATWGIFDTLG